MAESYRANLLNMIVEAEQHLRMYVTAYKQEPYDTGFMLKQYIVESRTRIDIARAALSEVSK